MTSKYARLYRRLVREVDKSSVVPRADRNKVISTHFRSLFHRNHQSNMFQYDMENILTFIGSQREYKARDTTLLERYNPLVDLTSEERIEATARRVGLNMPVTPSESDK
ncbi:hypothetical protein SCLCIDRAFT_104578 [Scleroderma citrinum Foug A]|uniref:Uncharacterized protein n=1 Tax=Scleroderma citrinum Foug A TaxID=1036808 RepID=A0A0C3EL34_9AGAM|nr:hypothetical protein SCLCIDRAFT_104578 [Scleroderma citrinum Foug A]